MTRFERNRKKNTVRKRLTALFLFVTLLAAVVTSMFFMGIPGKENNTDAIADASSPNIATTFKYSSEIGGKVVYRIELGNFESFGEAEDFIKSIKAKKLNGYIVKEEGYKAVYGIFTGMEEASAVHESIAKKIKGSITEIKLQGYSLSYNDGDNSFIQLAQASDKLLWEVIKAKSQLSQDSAVKAKKNSSALVEEISKGEAKLEKYLGYARDLKVSKEQKALRDNLVLLLEDVLVYRTDSDKDYYKLQNGLLNQVEAYRTFIEKLSI